MSIIVKDILKDENDEPLETTDGRIVCRIENSSGEDEIVPLDKQLLIDSNILNVTPIDSPVEIVDKKECDWSDEMTRMVLDKYDEYISEVGPMKTFRIKKKMWEQIANDINTTFEINKSAQQVENRFKTVLKRKKNVMDNNKKSGAKRQKIEFEDELQRIVSKDDSIQPEIMRDQRNIIIKQNADKEKPVRKVETVLKTFKRIHAEKQAQRDQMHKEREENKERRHREKLDILKELFKKS